MRFGCPRCKLGKLFDEIGFCQVKDTRLKNEKEVIKKQVLALKLMNGQSGSLIIDEHCKLIVTYSDSRAKKDAVNRKRGIEKLERSIKSGKLTKSNCDPFLKNKRIQAEYPASGTTGSA